MSNQHLNDRDQQCVNVISGMESMPQEATPKVKKEQSVPEVQILYEVIHNLEQDLPMFITGINPTINSAVSFFCLPFLFDEFRTKSDSFFLVDLIN